MQARHLTERLILRPFLMDDLSKLYALFFDVEVMRYIGDGSLPTQAQLKKSLARWIEHYDNYGYSLLALTDRFSKALLGFCGLIAQTVEQEEKVELGYRLGRQYWSKGYATEAAIAMRDHAFNDLKLDELISIIQPDNIGSIKVAEKLGMEHEKDIIFHDVPVCIYHQVRV